MILPIQAALERVPASLIEASGDLGATPRQAFATVILPLALPGVVAGSIFTFSLTLGDYIIPQIVGSSRLFIGQAVYIHQGTAGNIPLAAAFTVVPIVRSEEHTSELQSLMRISYAVFCLKKKKHNT